MRNGFCVYDNMSTSHCLLDETQRPFQLEPWPSETKERPSLFCLFLSTKPTSSFFVGDPKFDSSIKKKREREKQRCQQGKQSKNPSPTESNGVVSATVGLYSCEMSNKPNKSNQFRILFLPQKIRREELYRLRCQTGQSKKVCSTLVVQSQSMQFLTFKAVSDEGVKVIFSLKKWESGCERWGQRKECRGLSRPKGMIGNYIEPAEE